MGGWSAWHWVITIGLLVWLVVLTVRVQASSQRLAVLTVRVRALSRRLAVHVCPQPGLATSDTAADPAAHDELDQPINAYELINRVQRSNRRQPPAPPPPQTDAELTEPVGRCAPPERPPQAAGRGQKSG